MNSFVNTHGLALGARLAGGSLCVDCVGDIIKYAYHCANPKFQLDCTYANGPSKARNLKRVGRCINAIVDTNH